MSGGAILARVPDPHVRNHLVRALRKHFMYSTFDHDGECVMGKVGDSTNVDRAREFCSGFLANREGSDPANLTHPKYR